MSRRLTVEWPDARLFASRDGEPFRLLAVSDQRDPALNDERSRAALGRIDLVLGCGDLRAEDLQFIADATRAPLIFVLGNHDSGEAWRRASAHIPAPIDTAREIRTDGLTILGLPWPRNRGSLAARTETGAWRQAVALGVRLLPRRRPVIVMSHVPPLGVGDCPSDAYHRGYAAYRWLLRRVRPVLWLHGHTPLAAVADWHQRAASTTVVNVTGAVVIELCRPGSAPDRDTQRGVPEV